MGKRFGRANKQNRGRHSTLEYSLDKSVRLIEGLPYVKKVGIGLSHGCRHKFLPGTIVYQEDVNGGIRVKGYSQWGIVDIFMYCTSNKE